MCHDRRSAARHRGRGSESRPVQPRAAGVPVRARGCDADDLPGRVRAEPRPLRTGGRAARRGEPPAKRRSLDGHRHLGHGRVLARDRRAPHGPDDRPGVDRRRVRGRRPSRRDLGLLRRRPGDLGPAERSHRAGGRHFSGVPRLHLRARARGLPGAEHPERDPGPGLPQHPVLSPADARRCHARARAAFRRCRPLRGRVRPAHCVRPRHAECADFGPGQPVAHHRLLDSARLRPQLRGRRRPHSNPRVGLHDRDRRAQHDDRTVVDGAFSRARARPDHLGLRPRRRRVPLLPGPREPPADPRMLCSRSATSRWSTREAPARSACSTAST